MSLNISCIRAVASLASVGAFVACFGEWANRTATGARRRRGSRGRGRTWRSSLPRRRAHRAVFIFSLRLRISTASSIYTAAGFRMRQSRRILKSCLGARGSAIPPPHACTDRITSTHSCHREQLIQVWSDLSMSIPALFTVQEMTLR